MNLPMIGCFLGMAAALAVVLYLKKNIGRCPFANALVGLLLVVILGCGFGMMHYSGVLREMGLDFGYTQSKLNSDAAIYAAQADMILPVLKTANLDGAKILLVHSPADADSETYRAFLERLKSLGVDETKIVDVLAPEAPKAPKAGAGNPMMAPQRLTAQALNKAASSHSECKVVIAMTGLPYSQAAGVACFAKRQSASAQQWVIMEPVGDMALIQSGLATGNVLAVSCFCENPKGEVTSVPDDPRKCFELRYQLKTR